MPMACAHVMRRLYLSIKKNRREQHYGSSIIRLVALKSNMFQLPNYFNEQHKGMQNLGIGTISRSVKEDEIIFFSTKLENIYIQYISPFNCTSAYSTLTRVYILTSLNCYNKILYL